MAGKTRASSRPWRNRRAAQEAAGGAAAAVAVYATIAHQQRHRGAPSAPSREPGLSVSRGVASRQSQRQRQHAACGSTN